MTSSSTHPSASHDTTNSSYPSINILGAGIAGLSLACHLRRRRIPFTIFDAASKPKGHTYGITISPRGYTDLLPMLEPKPTAQSFRDQIAADKPINGHGLTSPDKKDDIRASDSSLRDLLAKDHQIKWNHKVTSAEPVPQGLKLNFDNGTDSTAHITIDAGGERSGLTSLLLPDLTPEVLPYAVYHGSRYMTSQAFSREFNDIFRADETVRSFPPDPSSTWHLQLARSYVTLGSVPSKIRPSLSTTSPTDPIIELRYTFSRPSTTTPDPLFNPHRTPSEATQTPAALYDAMATYLSSTPTLPQSLSTLLSPDSLRKDRILNWLMRVKTQAIRPEHVELLASKSVIAIGDAVHACPPVQSEGASLAMEDARAVAEWIASDRVEGSTEQRVRKFYEERTPVWRSAMEGARERLRDMHVPESRQIGGQNAKLSGKI